jgi:hypothetical protein
MLRLWHQQTQKLQCWYLLMGGVYETGRWEGLTWRETHTKFYDDQLRRSSNIKVITSTFWETAVLVLLMLAIFKICLCDALRWHDNTYKLPKPLIQEFINC